MWRHWDDFFSSAIPVKDRYMPKLLAYLSDPFGIFLSTPVTGGRQLLDCF